MNASGHALRVAAAAFASLTVAALGFLTTSTTAPAQDGTPAVSRADLLEALADPARAATALQPAFEAFVGAMDDFDGPAAVEIARAMHASALRIREGATGYDVLWSAFCLEGALRRSAPESGPTRALHLAEAREVITLRLVDPLTTAPEREALLQRLAILEAGFGQSARERASLGGALGLHGVDGAQITGLERLDSGDPITAAALFAALLDSLDPARVSAPWALRGHALAVLDGAPE